MFSSKNARQEIMLILRAGSKLVVLIAVLAMLFTSMATYPSAAARPPTPTPINPTPTLASGGCTSPADLPVQNEHGRKNRPNDAGEQECVDHSVQTRLGR
jgi:hypothetical protein